LGGSRRENTTAPWFSRPNVRLEITATDLVIRAHTTVLERLHEEFRRRVKTQSSLPTEGAALVLLFGLVASGQIRLRLLDGWRRIPAVLCQGRRPAA
jgi:hypothetical protein